MSLFKKICEKDDKSFNEESAEKYKIILNQCYEECKNQDQRKNNVDTKASYMLVVLVFVVGILLQNNNLNVLNQQVLVDKTLDFILKCILCIVYIADLIFCLISWYYFTDVLINKKYKKISNELWDIDKVDKATYKEVLEGLVSNYNEVNETNSSVNDEVLKSYKKGVKFLNLAFFVTVISYAFIIIITGGDLNG